MTYFHYKLYAPNDRWKTNYLQMFETQAKPEGLKPLRTVIVNSHGLQHMYPSNSYRHCHLHALCQILPLGFSSSF